MRKTLTEIQKAEIYWKQAMEFVTARSDNPRNPTWFEITREMPEHVERWKAYFRWRFGFVTHGLDLLIENKIGVFFVPTEWPEWFDAGFIRAA